MAGPATSEITNNPESHSRRVDRALQAALMSGFHAALQYRASEPRPGHPPEAGLRPRLAIGAPTPGFMRQRTDELLTA